MPSQASVLERPPESRVHRLRDRIIKAPQEVPVHREEVYHRILAESDGASGAGAPQER